MKKFSLVLILALNSLTLVAAPGGASSVAKGHGAAVKAAAKDPARVKGAGGVSATAKGHGAAVSGTVRQNQKADAGAAAAPAQ